MRERIRRLVFFGVKSPRGAYRGHFYFSIALLISSSVFLVSKKLFLHFISMPSSCLAGLANLASLAGLVSVFPVYLPTLPKALSFFCLLDSDYLP